jgi:predicted nucleic acid-binding protein
MITAVDTNVFVALWDRDPALSAAAQRALEEAADEGRLRIAAPVYCELMAAPGRTSAFVEGFLRETGVEVEWQLPEAVWRSAGRSRCCGWRTLMPPAVTRR